MRLATPVIGLTILACAALAPLTAGDPSTLSDPRPRVVDVVADSAPVDGPRIQIALLLDDSGSMEGLIGQARSYLWDVVNRLSHTTRNGVHPRIEVALYHYGDVPALARPLAPFTTDLDEVSRLLFAINGGGGEERCGEVIRNAGEQLDWSVRPTDLKMIIIAGNEPFTQGPVDWASACRAVKGRGITVTTVHCGDREAGIGGLWAEGARLGGGTFACIDQNRALSRVIAPQDEAISRLNVELNSTYLPYGANGAASAQKQAAQDQNAAASAPAAACSRAAVKASGAYQNGSWDLVDAVRDGKVAIATLEDAELPTQLQALPADQREAEVTRQSQRRIQVQTKMTALVTQREAWVAANQPAAAADDLRAALVGAVEQQATEAGYTSAKP